MFNVFVLDSLVAVLCVIDLIDYPNCVRTHPLPLDRPLCKANKLMALILMSDRSPLNASRKVLCYETVYYFRWLLYVRAHVSVLHEWVGMGGIES